MNYLYSKLEYGATFEANTVERKAFKKHLALVAQALHDIEWVDSSDYCLGDEVAAIRACLHPSVLLETALENAREAVAALQAEIAKAEGK
jgi:glutathione S-transferase